MRSRLWSEIESNQLILQDSGLSVVDALSGSVVLNGS